MRKLKRFLGRLANRALDRLGVRLVPTRPGPGDLALYEERERPATPRYINIGAGSFFHPYWHNMDTPSPFYAAAQKGHIHIEYDLKSGRPFPLEGGSLKAAYISHVIEHLSDAQVRFCCAEVHRCLRPGGFFRLACPDIDLEYDAYRRGDETFFPRPTPWRTSGLSIDQRFLEHFATALALEHPESPARKLTDEEIRAVFAERGKEEALDHFVGLIPSDPGQSFPEHHVNWFNARKLGRILEDAGFAEVYESRYGQSKCPLMRNTQLFDSTVPAMSFYMECRK